MNEDRQFYFNLRDRARDAGFLNDTPAAYAALLVCVSAFFGAAYAMLFFANEWQRYLLLIPVAFGMVQYSYLGHDAGHFALSSKRRINTIVGVFSMTVMNGLAFSYWRKQHDQHHRHSQLESRDPDMQSDVVALYAESARNKRGIGKLVTRFQAPLILFLYFMHPFQIRLDGVRYVLRNPDSTRNDQVALLGHVAVYLLLPAIALGWQVALVNYLFVSMLCGLFYGPAFITNHVGTESFTDAHQISYWRRQIIGSRNVRVPEIFDYYFGALNFQIEHHLFPDMSRFHFRRFAPLVRAECERVRIPYRSESFPEAIRNVLRHLHELSRLRSDRKPGHTTPFMPGSPRDEWPESGPSD